MITMLFMTLPVGLWEHQRTTIFQVQYYPQLMDAHEKTNCIA